MAVEAKKNEVRMTQASTGLRVRIATNVTISIILAIGIVAFLQFIAFDSGKRWDLTSSGINSLSEGTERLLRDLETNVTLTSLYFETDREDENQQKYRRAASDLLNLYEGTNRSKITTRWVNPLKDHDKYKNLLSELQNKEQFKEELEPYIEGVNRFTEDIYRQMGALIESEKGLLGKLATGLGGDGLPPALARIEQALVQEADNLTEDYEQVQALKEADVPDYGGALEEIKTLYRNFKRQLEAIAAFGQEQARLDTQLTPEQAAYLRGAQARYQDLIKKTDEASAEAQALQPLDVDRVTRELLPTGNAILVETENDARVVDFSSIWPPVRPDLPARNLQFGDRAFKGEEKVTSAILRVTHEEQTAVVFVRYGGGPLFFGGFMPGQPQAPFAQMKAQLEDANFIVEEWDLKTTTTPPEIEPKPSKTIYLVLKPAPPQQQPMGQQMQDPPFGPQHRKAILDAIGRDGRAIFLAGWTPAPMGPFPADYEYAEYLKEEWGIDLKASTLLLQMMGSEPGKYDRGTLALADADFSDHPIVSGATVRRLTLPQCASLTIEEELPEGVSATRLLSFPARDGLWGVKDIQAYQEQAAKGEFTRIPGDLEGPFTVACAASRGSAAEDKAEGDEVAKEDKVIVITSAAFAIDAIAFDQELGLGPQGLILRSRNPGNVALLVNSLHWLNDNTGFMDIGRPIDTSTLEIKHNSTSTWVEVLTVFVWPALALCAGGVAWLVRRR